VPHCQKYTPTDCAHSKARPVKVSLKWFNYSHVSTQPRLDPKLQMISLVIISVSLVCTRYEDLIEKIASSKPEKVVSSIHHAVLSCNPQSRYTVGFDANTLWLAIAVLPTAIGDWLTSMIAPPIVPRSVLRRNKKVD